MAILDIKSPGPVSVKQVSGMPWDVQQRQFTILGDVLGQSVLRGMEY
jgi:hypothetical protein